MAETRVTVLVENSAARRGILAEHGLSLWIELGRRKILFDTGQGRALKNNSEALGIKPESVDSIVLSHGHYDHTGGVSSALLSQGPRVYAHPEAFEPKYSRQPDGTARYIGIPESARADIRSCAELINVMGPAEIGEGLWVTGPIPRATGYEDTGGPFFRDRFCREPDELSDDQAACLETQSGVVVILGCAHAGVINTLQYVQELTSRRPIRAVIGGMHLISADSRRMDETVSALRRMEIGRIMPCHCTGLQAMTRLRLEFPGKYMACPAGTSIEIDD